MIIEIGNVVHKNKLAIFDYDWTLVSPKEGRTFPKDISDWVWLYKDIPLSLKKYFDKDYMIIVVTNQSKKWKIEQIKEVLKPLNIPISIIICTDKLTYKPDTKLFNEYIEQYDKSQSFFVGDALGRTSDYSDSDKVFSENLGIKYYSPESIFYNVKDNKVELSQYDKIELDKNVKYIIIMVGYPGSGKSTIAKYLCDKYDIEYISGDIYKQQPKMIKVAKSHIVNGRSILFDATNSSSKKREKYIELCNVNRYTCICIYNSTDELESFRRNKQRDETKQVPKIAYSIYNKYFEKPTENEGFKLYII